jgi:hypothetical protein
MVASKPRATGCGPLGMGIDKQRRTRRRSRSRSESRSGSNQPGWQDEELNCQYIQTSLLPAAYRTPLSSSLLTLCMYITHSRLSVAHIAYSGNVTDTGTVLLLMLTLVLSLMLVCRSRSMREKWHFLRLARARAQALYQPRFRETQPVRLSYRRPCSSLSHLSEEGSRNTG